MMTGVESILAFLFALTAIPVVVFFIQVLAALFDSDPKITDSRDAKDDSSLSSGCRPRIAILVPAHNEAAGITEILTHLSAQLNEADRLLVVADNCSDGTAEIARKTGAEVVERNDFDLRGKGYALDFGLRCLESDPPEVVLIVDADCWLKTGSIDRLARAAAATGRPVQALYLMLSPGVNTVNRLMARFAWIIKNKVRPLGYRRLGWPCQLMGTGMAFPWTVIGKATLASDHIVEDLKLGIDLAKQGLPPLFCPEAEVISYFPASEEGAASQRMRWVHGHLGMIASDAPGLLMSGLLKGNPGLIAMALDLCIPPLSLLVLWVAAMCAVGLLGSVVSGNWLIFSAASVLLFLLSLSVALCWLRFGRHLFGLGNLGAGLGYIFGKIPLFYAFFVDRQVEWVRAKRDQE